MTVLFEWAGGSVPGRDHCLAGRNNQDAYAVVESEERLTAVVADGCGSGRKSEVGAELGARLLAGFLQTHTIEQACRKTLGELMRLVRALPAKAGETVEQLFLFTLVGAVIDPEQSHFFALGDGWIVVNGERTRLGPFPNNAPPYLGYGFRSDPALIRLDDFGLRNLKTVNTTALESFLLATDGADDLIAAEGRIVPGREAFVDGLETFWKKDLFFRNADAVRRHLTVLGREHLAVRPDGQTIEHEHGFLRDDTTLVVGRRRA